MILPEQLQYDAVVRLTELLDNIRVNCDINATYIEISSIVVYGPNCFALARMNKFVKIVVYLAILFDTESSTKYLDCITYVYTEFTNLNDVCAVRFKIAIERQCILHLDKRPSDSEVVEGGSLKWFTDERSFEELNPQIAAQQAFGVINLIGGLYLVHVLQTAFVVSIVMGCLKGNYNYDYYLGARLFRYLDAGCVQSLMCINPMDSLNSIEHYRLACKRMQMIIKMKRIQPNVKALIKDTWNNRKYRLTNIN